MYRSFWHELADKRKPVFIYGTGNGADKIMDILAALGVPVAGVFASDGFVRSREFRGFGVCSYNDIREGYGDDIVILAAFGSALPEVLDFLRLLDARHELYIPEVPLFCDDLLSELFDDAYYAAHLNEIEEAKVMLSDSESVLLYSEMIAHRLTGRLDLLMRTQAPAESVSSLLRCNDIHYAIDGGAFKGDTAAMFCDVFPSLKWLIAVEPDKRSFRRLEEMASSRGDGIIYPINAMLDEVSGEKSFSSSGSRGSASGSTVGQIKRSKEITVSAVSVDSLLSELPSGRLDFLKLDTEGFELPSLKGASEALAMQPALSVSLYHRSSDIFRIPLYLKKFYPSARFYLRRDKCVPEWDLTLYVTK